MTAEERRVWLIDRQSCLTGTDIRRLIIPYASDDVPQAAKIFDEKKLPPEDDRKVHPLLRMGLALEDLNAELYSERTMFAVAKPADNLSKHPLERWIGASLDRVVAGADGRPVELKYVGPFFNDSWGEEESDFIPLGYLVQVTWQMFVISKEVCDVSALSGVGLHQIFRVGFNEELHALLFEIGNDFWNDFVLGSNRPPADWVHPKVELLTEKLKESRAGSFKVIHEPAAVHACREYLHFRQIQTEAENQAKSRKAKLITAYMEDFEKADCGPFTLNRAPRATFVKFKPKSTKKRFFE